jgi:hypothetical protein
MASGIGKSLRELDLGQNGQALFVADGGHMITL